MNTFKIEIGGKGYTLLFGYTCYKLFMTRCFRYKDTYLTEDKELTRLGLANLFHSAYQDYCYDVNSDVELRFNDISEWLDSKYETDEGQEEIAKALEVWAQSKEVKKLKEEVEKKSQVENGQNQTSTTSTQLLQAS